MKEKDVLLSIIGNIYGEIEIVEKIIETMKNQLESLEDITNELKGGNDE